MALSTKEKNDFIEKNISVLEVLIRRLSLLSQIAVIATFCNISCLFLIISFIYGGGYNARVIFHALLVVSTSVSGMSLVSVVFFENLRKKGETLFEEISDEVQWRIRKLDRSVLGVSAPDKRPDIGIRVVLRNFAKSSDLPLVPGKFGPTIYVLVNFMCTLWLAVQHQRFLP